jgi:predicted nuclease of predicted toxin-antitoxin system
MKFLVDAQFPYQLSDFLNKQGFDTIHTDDLPKKERSSDKEIRELAHIQNRIVITKDSDFIHSYYFQNKPSLLLLVSTGNIRNAQLMNLFSRNMESIQDLFLNHSFVELTNEDIIGHE